MARDLFAINANEAAWGELRNLMPKDYGKTPPVDAPRLKQVAPVPTQEQQELTCPKLREIESLKKQLALTEAELAQYRRT